MLHGHGRCKLNKDRNFDVKNTRVEPHRRRYVMARSRNALMRVESVHECFAWHAMEVGGFGG